MRFELSKQIEIRNAGLEFIKAMDYGLFAELQMISALGLHRRTGIGLILGHTGDLSEWLDLKFYFVFKLII